MISSAFSRLFVFATLLILSTTLQAQEINETYKLYQKNGDFYLKTDPSWVPISSSVLFFIPHYQQGEILKLSQVNGSWQVEQVSFSQFNSIAPLEVVDGGVSYQDLNSDGISDITVSLGSANGNAQVELLTSNGSSLAFAVRQYNVDIPSLPVVAQAPTNPLTSKETGAIPGQMNVSHGGTATWSTNIEIPEGIAGYKPDISISYSSGSGNSTLGLGWNISATSAITRCRKYFEEDGQYEGVEFTNADPICMGGERLILDPSFSHFADGAEYRPKFDPATKVVLHKSGSTTYFTVHKATGEVFSFGLNANSRVNDQASGVTYQWLLTERTDTYNNVIEYEYSSNATKAKVIELITYAGNEVDFQYSTRTDDSRTFYNGNATLDDQILSDIVIRNHNGIAINSYHFEHELSQFSSRNLLKEIKRCNGSISGVCLQPTTFDYNDDIPMGLQAQSEQIVISLSDFFNTESDKANDYCEQQSNKRYPKAFCTSKSLTLGDTDGDGFSELIVMNGVGDKYEIQNIHVDETGYTLGNLYKTGNLFKQPQTEGISTYYIYGAGLQVVDTNGDGIDEVTVNKNFPGTKAAESVWADIDGDGIVEEIYGHSRGAEAYIRDNLPEDFAQCEGLMTNDLHIDSRTANTFDFNGDGLIDRLVEVTGMCEDIDGAQQPIESAFVLMKNTTIGTTFSEVAVPIEVPEKISKAKIGDINGDGYLDFSEKGCFTGTGFTEACLDENNLDLRKYSAVSGETLYYGVTGFADINLDGKDDLLYYTKSGQLRADLSELKPTAQGNSSILIGTAQWTDLPKETANFMWIDLDGDGLPALVYFDKAKQKIYIRHDANTDNQEPDLLLHVDNGMGLRGSFEYENLLRSDNYQKLGSTTSLNWGRGSPVFNSTGDFTAVTQFTKTAGLDEYGNDLLQTTQYNYKGLRYQAGGRGSLGFYEVTETDLTSKTRTKSQYKQNYPYDGRLQKTILQNLSSDAGYQTTFVSEVKGWSNTSFFNGKVLSIHEVNVEERSYTLAGINGVVDFQPELVKTVTTESVYERDTALNIRRLKSQTKTQEDALSGLTNIGSAEYFYEDEDQINWRISRPTKVESTFQLYDGATLLDSKVQVTRTAYNSDGKVESTENGQLPTGNDETQISQYLKQSMIYDQFGNLKSATTCSSHYATNCATRAVPTDLGTNEYRVFARNIFEYDAQGRYLISKSNALFAEQYFSDFNALGIPTTQTDANGVSSYSYYDEFGRAYFSAADDGSYSQVEMGICYSDCPSGATSFVKTTTPIAPDSIVYLDPLGRKVAVRTQSLNGEWVQVRYEFNEKGEMVTEFLPHFVNSSTVHSSSFYYDNLGRKWKEVASDGTVRTLQWQGLQETSTVVSAFYGQYSQSNVNQQTKKTLNGLGQLILSEDANGNQTTYEYDALGLMTKATNMDASSILVTYDDYGRKTSLNDPDKGYVQYKYNATGTMVRRISPSGDNEISYFDAVGRLTKSRTESSAGNVTGTFNYEGPRLDNETGSEGIFKQYGYDHLGRLTSVEFQADGNSWATGITYDHLGRVFQEFDASGNARGTQYTYQNGYMSSLREARDSSLVYYQPQAMDAWGNITRWTLANGATGNAQFDAQTGFLEALFATNGVISVQDHLYEYDGLGNLRARVDKNGDSLNNELVEVFDYDSLNRLESVDFQGVRTLSLSYYDNGNIKSKSDVANNGIYTYGQKATGCSATPGIHAVSSIGNQYRYCYDNKGNQTAAYENGTLKRSITYSGFDKPKVIESSDAKTWFYYDAGHQRFKRVDNETAGEIKTTYFIGNVEIVNSSTGINEIKRYIGEFVIDTIRSNGTSDTYYLTKDHIGSIVTMMDGDGSFSEKLSYDAFGKRRNGTSWNPVQKPFTNITIASVLDITQKGFTGHEHVDHADIIHMGGRIYDQYIGRFVQADPIVQAPDNGQSLNRYSYVFNNPLSYTDPSGYTAVETGDKRGGSRRIELVRLKHKYSRLRDSDKVRDIKKEIEKLDEANELSNGAFESEDSNGVIAEPSTSNSIDGVENIHSRIRSSDDYLQVRHNDFVSNAGGPLNPIEQQEEAAENVNESVIGPLYYSEEFLSVAESARLALNDTVEMQQYLGESPAQEYGIVIYMNDDGSFRHGKASIEVLKGKDALPSGAVSDFAPPPIPIKGHGAVMIIIRVGNNDRRITVEGNTYRYNHVSKITGDVPVMVYGGRSRVRYLATGEESMKKLR